VNHNGHIKIPSGDFQITENDTVLIFCINSRIKEVSKIFKSEEHTKRFFEGAKTMDMEIPFTQSEILNAKKELIISNGLKDAYVRPIAWRGSEMMAVSAQKTTINVAIASWAWPSYFDPSEKIKGIKLDISKWRRP